MPLSEEEQRILQEMEQKLREHDREFVDRVSRRTHRFQSSRGAKWSVFFFILGTVFLLGTFRSSAALGICSVLVMVASALVFAQSVSADTGRPERAQDQDSDAGESDRHPGAPLRRSRTSRNAGIAEEWSEMRRRMRSRFGHRD
ncbi:MAG: DUF3040 domain-containing protein [Acidimicrobiales bacterium]